MAFATHQSEEWSQSVSVLSGLIRAHRECVTENGKSQPHLSAVDLFFLSEDHQDCYRDAREKIGSRGIGISERHSVEKLLPNFVSNCFL